MAAALLRPDGARDWLARFRLALGFGWEADPRGFAQLMAAELVGGAAALGALFGLKLLTEAALRHDPPAAVGAAAIVAGCGACSVLGRSSYVRLTLRLGELTLHLLDSRLMQAVGRPVGLEHHERPEYADQLTLVHDDRNQLAGMANSVALTLRLLIDAVGGAVLLALIHPALLLLPLLGVPIYLGSQRAGDLQQRARDANAPRQRLRRHLIDLATTAGPGKEVRLFGLADDLLARHQRVCRESVRQLDRAEAAGGALRAAGTAVFVAGYAAAIGVALWQAVRGLATAGDVVLATALAAQLGGSVTRLVGITTQIHRTVRVAGRYRWLARYAEEHRRRPGDPASVPDRLVDGIVLDRVSFTYPGLERPVLSDVSLRLPAGAVVALVGENGAGKTSLVKLLLRFYEPSGPEGSSPPAGRILVDGVDLRRFDPDAWRRRVSAAFQDYCRFELRVRETVGVGDLAQIDRPPAVEAALARAGAADLVCDLPDGLETQLGTTWEGGVDLSGGQWQKLALARAFMRRAPLLVVFDEPTAAIDAETEHALFNRVAAAATTGRARGAVTLLISHRFSTVRMADLIVVLDSGRVLEAGSHAELVARGGRYAELFALQSRAYR